MKSRDLTGKTFGRLTAILISSRIKKRVKWLCRCSCGNEVEVRGSSLTDGNTASCGCLIRESMSRVGKSNRTHGMSRTPEYRAWARMIHRCYEPADIKYHLYGGRGITVCERWRYSFENFLSDMGSKPSHDLSLDRRESDGNYEPSNCRWATDSEQNKNRRPFKRNRAQGESYHGV